MQKAILIRPDQTEVALGSRDGELFYRLEADGTTLGRFPIAKTKRDLKRLCRLNLCELILDPDESNA